MKLTRKVESEGGVKKEKGRKKRWAMSRSNNEEVYYWVDGEKWHEISLSLGRKQAKHKRSKAIGKPPSAWGVGDT